MTAHPEPTDAPEGRSGVKPLTVLWAMASVLVLVGAIVAWVAIERDDGSDDSQTIELVVPAGTKARQDAGETVVVMDELIELRVGDRMIIRNNDSSLQSVGPYRVKPGEVTTVTYGYPGVYEGVCELTEGKRYQIVVTE